LEGGADPEIRDGGGKCVVTLVSDLRLRMPVNPGMVQRRLALEQVRSMG
jgi:hypothetical protein